MTRRTPLFRLSIRMRITLWVVAIFFVVHITLSLVVLLYKRNELLAESALVARSLSDAARAVVMSRDSAGDVPEAALDAVLRAHSEGRASAVALIDAPTGRVIACRGVAADELTAMLGDPVTEAAAAVLGGNCGSFRTDSRSGATLTIRIDELADAQGRAVILVAAASYMEAERSVGLIMQMLLLGVPVTLLSIAAASWIISGIAVRPLRQLEAFATQLGPENVGDPLDLDDASPEAAALRAKLEAAMERLERAYDEQARFLATISHEIKTPISIVRAQAEVVRMKNRNPGERDLAEVDRFIDSTAEEMKRLGGLVESFLLLTRVEHGHSRVRRSKLPANDLTMNAFEQCGAMAQEHGVELHPTLCEDETEAVVHGSPELIETGIGNLIRNAIRFTPEAGKVEIDCRTRDGGSSVVFGVRDHGPGVPPELLPRLFEPYTQSSDERRRGRGTGLGLQIAKGIAELHRGTVEVENLDRGCEFRFILPAADADTMSPREKDRFG
ncbi:MAG: ATP-binding protein [Planctomycetota bacterium]